MQAQTYLEQDVPWSMQGSKVQAPHSSVFGRGSCARGQPGVLHTPQPLPAVQPIWLLFPTDQLVWLGAVDLLEYSKQSHAPDTCPHTCSAHQWPQHAPSLIKTHAKCSVSGTSTASWSHARHEWAACCLLPGLPLPAALLLCLIVPPKNTVYMSQKRFA